MPDNYDQPTDDELEALANYKGTPAQYAAFLSDIYPSYGKVKAIKDALGYRIQTITGGWSGCEEIDSVIQQGVGEKYDPGMFRMLFWESDHRGGLTEYRVPNELWDKEMYLGTISNAEKGPSNDAG